MKINCRVPLLIITFGIFSSAHAMWDLVLKEFEDDLLEDFTEKPEEISRMTFEKGDAYLEIPDEAKAIWKALEEMNYPVAINLVKRIKDFDILNWPDYKTGNTFLHVAVIQKKRDLAVSLIATNLCDITIKNREGKTAEDLGLFRDLFSLKSFPLYQTIYDGNVDLVESILAENPETIYFCGVEGIMPIALATLCRARGKSFLKIYDIIRSAYDDQEEESEESFEEISSEEEMLDQPESKRETYEKKKILCNTRTCRKGFLTRQKIIDHIKKEHADRIICYECGTSYESDKFYAQHRRAKHSEEKYRVKNNEEKKTSFGCNLRSCKNKINAFDSVENLILHHKKTHKKHKICNKCGYAFRDSTRLKSHDKTVHLGEKVKCSSCEKKFANKINLDRHIKSMHLREREICNICKATFTSSGGLSNHKRTAHKKHRFYCTENECSASYTSQANLDSHIAFKHRFETVECPTCKKQFSSKPSLSHHSCTKKKTK